MTDIVQIIAIIGAIFSLIMFIISGIMFLVVLTKFVNGMVMG